MKPPFFSALLFFVSLAGQADEGLFSKAIRTHAQDEGKGAVNWSQSLKSVNDFCIKEAVGAWQYSRSSEALRKGANHDRKVQRETQLQHISYNRNWEIVKVVRYAIQEKKLTPIEFAGFVGASCLAVPFLATRQTDLYLELPYLRTKDASIAFLLNMEPNWMRAYLDTMSPTCAPEPESAAADTRAAIEQATSCYLAQFLESPIKAQWERS